jgi:PAS domain S-box-containing protein
MVRWDDNMQFESSSSNQEDSLNPEHKCRQTEVRVEEAMSKSPAERVHNAAGEVEGVFVHSVDLTEQVEGRRSEESETSLKAIFNQASFGIAETDLTGRIVLANRRYCELVGRSLDELTPMRTADVTHPDDRERDQELYNRAAVSLDEAFVIEKRLLRPNGETVWVHKSLSVVRDEQGQPKYFLCVVQDITARKQAEEALRESEQQLKTLADSIPQLVWMAEPSGFVFWFNRRWYEYTGTSFDEVQGWGWQAVHDPEVLPRVLDLWRKSLHAGSPNEMEFPLRGADGAFRRFLTRVIPLRDGHGNVTRWFGTSTDIEDQKRAEEAVRQKQNLESTAVLAGGVAHDFNNLLTGVLGNASLALEGLSSSDPNAEYLREIVQATERAAHLTRQMLAYAGKGSFILKRLDLSTHVREIGTLIHAAIPRQVAVEMALTPDLPVIEADPGQLQEIVMNLVINAAEAIGEGRSGKVRVATRCQNILQATEARFIPECPAPGAYVVLAVEDDGVGMTEDVRSKIFDPFFSTKFAGRGLGLSAVLGIVRRLRGAVTVESESGRGSRIQAYFAAVPREEQTGQINELGLTESGGVVLVVDDEEMVRGVAKHALEHHGYSVLVANDGREGVEVFRENASRINVVLLDLVMPVMGGEETLQALRSLHPNVPVILSSGYDETRATSGFQSSQLSAFLQKPYTASQLVSVVARVLRKPGRIDS